MKTNLGLFTLILVGLNAHAGGIAPGNTDLLNYSCNRANTVCEMDYKVRGFVERNSNNNVTLQFNVLSGAGSETVYGSIDTDVIFVGESNPMTAVRKVQMPMPRVDANGQYLFGEFPVHLKVSRAGGFPLHEIPALTITYNSADGGYAPVRHQWSNIYLWQL